MKCDGLIPRMHSYTCRANLNAITLLNLKLVLKLVVNWSNHLAPMISRATAYNTYSLQFVVRFTCASCSIQKCITVVDPG